MITQHPTDSPEALAAIAEDVPKNVWIHGSITYVYTGEDYVPVVQDSPSEN